MGSSRERVGSIFYEDLDKRKLSAKWAPKCLNVDQKRQRCQSSEQLLEFFRRDPNYFLTRFVTMGETWLYPCDPDTKQQSMDWWNSGSPLPKKIRVQKSTGKVLASIFWDQDGILIDYLPKGQIMNAVYYWSLLVQLKNILKEKCRPRVGHHGGLFIARKCPTHRALQRRRNWPTSASSVTITYPVLQIWPRRTTTCSLNWKNNWKVAIFRDAEIIAATETWLDGQLSEFGGLQKLEQQAKMCVELRGEYFE